MTKTQSKEKGMIGSNLGKRMKVVIVKCSVVRVHRKKRYEKEKER